MKKLIVLVLVLGLASAASAVTVEFELLANNASWVEANARRRSHANDNEFLRRQRYEWW